MITWLYCFFISCGLYLGLSASDKISTRSLTLAELGIFIRSLSLMLPVFVMRSGPQPSNHLQDGLLTLCLQCLLLKSARIRYSASHLLSVVSGASEETVRVLNIALTDLLPRLKSSNSAHQLAAIEAIYRILFNFYSFNPYSLVL